MFPTTVTSLGTRRGGAPAPTSSPPGTPAVTRHRPSVKELPSLRVHSWLCFWPLDPRDMGRGHGHDYGYDMGHDMDHAACLRIHDAAATRSRLWSWTKLATIDHGSVLSQKRKASR